MKKILITTLIALGIATYVYADISSSLVLYMPLDGRDVVGTSVVDRSITNARGTLTNGAIGAIGKKRQGIFFDGTNDYMPISNESTYDFDRLSPFSISVWLKPTITDTTVQLPVTKGVDTSPYSGIHFVTNFGCTYNNDAGKVSFAFASSFGADYLYVCTTNDTSINDGRWHNYTITYTGSSDVSGLKIYEDGVSLALSTGSNGNSLTASTLNNSPVTLGARSDGSPNNQELYNGTIDEVYIYSKTLSIDEVKELYRRGLIK